MASVCFHTVHVGETGNQNYSDIQIKIPGPPNFSGFQMKIILQPVKWKETNGCHTK